MYSTRSQSTLSQASYQKWLIQLLSTGYTLVAGHSSMAICFPTLFDEEATPVYFGGQVAGLGRNQGELHEAPQGMVSRGTVGKRSPGPAVHPDRRRHRLGPAWTSLSSQLRRLFAEHAGEPKRNLRGELEAPRPALPSLTRVNRPDRGRKGRRVGLLVGAGRIDPRSEPGSCEQELLRRLARSGSL
jgi:hypothetical protein